MFAKAFVKRDFLYWGFLICKFYVWRTVTLQVQGPARRYKRQAFTLSFAQEECGRQMNTSIAQKCANVTNFDIAPYLNNCVADAMVTRLPNIYDKY